MSKSIQEIYQKLTEPFPKEAMTKDTSRGFALTSIKAQYVRERLNEVMGVDGWETESQVVNQDEGGVAVSLKMTLMFPEGKKVTRTAFGGASRKGKGQTYGDLYKSAETDALCKVASNFGVGNDVFKGLVDANTLEMTTSTSSPKVVSVSKKNVNRPSFKKPKNPAPVEVEDEYADNF